MPVPFFTQILAIDFFLLPVAYLLSLKSNLTLGFLGTFLVVVVKNVEQAKFTGKKFKDKKYYKHTGHPGGIKEITPEKLLEKNKPGESLKLAVKRMLPGGVLGRKQLTKVKIYAGEEHPHAAQNPKVLDLGKLNSKNLIRN